MVIGGEDPAFILTRGRFWGITRLIIRLIIMRRLRWLSSNSLRYMSSSGLQIPITGITVKIPRGIILMSGSALAGG